MPTSNGGALPQEDIAQKLHVTLGTVRDHLAAIYAKFLITAGKSKVEQLRRKLQAAFVPAESPIENVAPPSQTTTPIPETSKKRLFGSEQIIDVPLWVGRDELLTELKQELVGGKKVIFAAG